MFSTKIRRLPNNIGSRKATTIFNRAYAVSKRAPYDEVGDNGTISYDPTGKIRRKIRHFLFEGGVIANFRFNIGKNYLYTGEETPRNGDFSIS